MPATNSPRWKRWGGRIALGAALLAFGSVFIWWRAANVQARRLVRPRNSSLTLSTEIPAHIDHRFRVPVDGAELDVWAVDARAPRPADPVDVVFLLHGVSDHKRTMAPLARRFSLAGLRVVLVDLRGHGESSRVPISFGVKERVDLSIVLDHVHRELGWPVENVGVYGPSYGAGVAIQWAGHDPRIKRVFTVASFGSMHRIVRPYMETTWGWIAFAIPDDWSDSIVDDAGAEVGFDPGEASPLAMIADSQARHVLLHSTDDQLVPYANAVELAATCPERCSLLTLRGKDHLQSMSGDTLRHASYRLFVGEDYPGDAFLDERYRGSHNP
ncbi:MAG: alpha/beta fold hydrolase [Myxococcota bacterium]